MPADLTLLALLPPATVLALGVVALVGLLRRCCRTRDAAVLEVGQQGEVVARASRSGGAHGWLRLDFIPSFLLHSGSPGSVRASVNRHQDP